MKRLILALALTATLAIAQNVMIFEPIEGGGVNMRPSNLTPAAATALLGEKKAQQASSWKTAKNRAGRTRHPKRLIANMAGTVYPSANCSRAIRMIRLPSHPRFSPKTESRAPILLSFSPKRATKARRSSHALERGLATSSARTLAAAPPEVSETLETQFAALDGAPVAGTIDASFTHMRIAPQLTWTKTGANSWKGDHTVAIYTRIQWTVQIKTPDLIVTRQQINISGTILGSCEVLSEVNYERQ